MKSEGWRTQAATTCLGWKLLKLVLKGHSRAGTDGPGLMISPASITLCLALLGGVVPSDKHEEFYKSMGASTAQEMKQAFQSLLSAFGDGKETTLRGGNAVYYAKDEPMSEEVREHFELFGALVNHSFENLGDAEGEINRWVSQQTRGTIPQLVNRQMLEQKPAVLLNALSFKGFWETKFDKTLTEKQFPFRLDKSRTAKVPMMMFRKTKILSARGRGYTAARLPYKKTSAWMPDLSFTAYLPDEDGSVSDVLESLAMGRNDHFHPEEYSRFGIPRFEFETSLDLLQRLQELGYPIGGLAARVIHKTKISVDEEGTRAAAATAIILRRSLPRPLPELIFDRPFVFCIGDEASGISLFSGVFSSPQ